MKITHTAIFEANLFRLVKMLKNVETELVELAIVTMEAFGKGIALSELCQSASKQFSLKVSINVKILFSCFVELLQF